MLTLSSVTPNANGVRGDVLVVFFDVGDSSTREVLLPSGSALGVPLTAIEQMEQDVAAADALLPSERPTDPDDPTRDAYNTAAVQAKAARRAAMMTFYDLAEAKARAFLAAQESAG